MTEQWTEPGFLAEAIGWADERLGELGRERTGEPEQPHVRIWATALRAPTAAGPVWSKANTPSLRHEVSVVERVSARVPDRVPPLLASDAEQRFRDAVGRVRDLVDELASYGVTETLQHDDLHDGQVFVKDGRNLILDWGDAVVSHPFFTMSVTLEGGVAWGLDDVADSEDIWPYVDSYLARYATDRPELRDAVPPALRLGWVRRALNNPEVTGEFSDTRLRMFMDGRPE